MRRRYSHSLASHAYVEEDVNPTGHIFNIADCMLVLMLGFLVALVTRYNIDLNEIPVETNDIIGIEIAMDADQDGEIDSTFEERGAVYYDSSTGKYYFVAD
ncbi:MAG: hypothetical protein Q4D34_05960 [Eggerthellaceae bacterium]|nr:hypothetical protein [Eggerthellaceae bacterium]